MRPIVAAFAGLALVTGCVSVTQSLEPIENAAYELDPAHAFLTASVTHFGISDYRIDLTGLEAQLDFDADQPTASRLSVQIDPMQLDTHYPNPDKKADWEAELSTGGRFLDGETYPAITFLSTSIEQTGDQTGRVSGDLSLRGITRPVTLDVTFNGSAVSPLDGGRRRIGFTATGAFKRSDFGMDALAQFVSDEVRISFSGEFIEAS